MSEGVGVVDKGESIDSAVDSHFVGYGEVVLEVREVAA